jgi:hypothetical protein
MTINYCAFCGEACEDTFCSVQCKLEFIGAEDLENKPQFEIMNEPYSGYNDSDDYEN